MRFNERYIAVGVTDKDEHTDEGVVIHIGGLGKFTVNEHGARKLADDILRNANYLWPDKSQADTTSMASEIREGPKP